MNLFEQGTAISFEHENDHILSEFLSHLLPLPQGAGTTVPREGINSSASIHFIMGGGKGKDKRIIHKNIKNKKRTVIVKINIS